MTGVTLKHRWQWRPNQRATCPKREFMKLRIWKKTMMTGAKSITKSLWRQNLNKLHHRLFIKSILVQLLMIPKSVFHYSLVDHLWNKVWHAHQLSHRVAVLWNALVVTRKYRDFWMQAGLKLLIICLLGITIQIYLNLGKVSFLTQGHLLMRANASLKLLTRLIQKNAQN